MVIYDDNATVATSSSTFTVQHGVRKVELAPAPMQPRQGGKMRRRHSVDFKPSAERNQVKHIEPMDDESRSVCWYSREEYDIIKARNSLIVKMMKTGHFRESNDHSFRGLEHKLKEGFKQRRANKFNSLNAVLEEQERQMAAGERAPERIARRYRRVSLNAAETAFVVGNRDAEESLCYHGSSPPRHLSPHSDYQRHSPQEYYQSSPPQRHQDHYTPEQHHYYSAPPPTTVDTSGEDNLSCMTPSVQGDDSCDTDTIASADSTPYMPEVHEHKQQVRELFTVASQIKKTGGRMGRRSSVF